MNIAILSRNENLYSTRRLKEAVEARGWTPQIIDFLRCSTTIEKNRHILHYQGKELEDINAVIPRIGASRTFYGSAIVRHMEMMGLVVLNKSLALTRSRDKLRSLQILSKHGVNMPKTVFASNLADVDDVIAMAGGTPIVIKILEGTQGVGVVLAETKKAAKSVLDAFYGMQVNILVQEYIGEANGEDVRAFIVGGEVVGAMKRSGTEGDFRSNLHKGGSASSVKLSRAEKSLAINAVKAMGLDIAGVDMLRSNRGPLVMEVNSSPGLEGIESATGIDIASKVMDFVEKLLQQKQKKDRIGA
ncbi:MAG: 30S ribosomal protein S6--L-glutamate ligase [Campylobacterales bacterium]